MDFETWLAEQDESTQALVTGHVQGLTSALSSERDARKKLAKDLKTAVGNSGATSEMRAQLTKMQSDLNAVTGRAEFFAAGHRAGVRNLELAYVAARESDLVSDSGEPDWDGMRTIYPELFGSAAPEPIVLGNGGNGRFADSPPETGVSMDNLIRRSAGVIK